MQDETIKAVVGQVCIAVLAIAALAAGQDGIVLGAAVGSLANLGGYFNARKQE
jgi:hypothetical protein